MLPILIVDDTAADAALAERNLRHCKILNPIITLHSGEAVLQYFSDEFEMPVLVLLDMIMQPVLGIDVLRVIHKRGLHEEIAFVMLSGLADYRILQEGYQLGARSFLVKPLTQEDILQLLSKLRGLFVIPGDGGYVITLASGLSAAEQKVLRFAQN